MKVMSLESIQDFLSQNEEWHYDRNALHAHFMFANFKEAFAFMTYVAFEAELNGHHPEWSNVYNKVEIRLTTHDAGDKVTDKDLALASLISEHYKH